MAFAEKTCHGFSKERKINTEFPAATSHIKKKNPSFAGRYSEIRNSFNFSFYGFNLSLSNNMT